MRERVFLAYQEPFSLVDTAAFVAGNLAAGSPHFVADDGGRIIGWCDLRRETIPIYAHEGMLGMGVADGETVLIADDGRSFAEALVRLYSDKVLWERLSDAGWNFINDAFSPARAEQRFNEIFHRLGKDALASDFVQPAPSPAAEVATAATGKARRRK